MTEIDVIRPEADVKALAAGPEAADARALRLGALPDAPLAMPTQALQAPARRRRLRALFTGPTGQRAGT